MIMPTIIRKIKKSEIENNRKYLEECRAKTLEELAQMLNGEHNYAEKMSIEIAISEKSNEYYTEEQVFDEINRQLDEEDYFQENGISRPNAN